MYQAPGTHVLVLRRKPLITTLMHLRAISNAADRAIHARISMRWLMGKDARSLYNSITVIQ
jgi:hypothetical protein